MRSQRVEHVILDKEGIILNLTLRIKLWLSGGSRQWWLSEMRTRLESRKAKETLRRKGLVQDQRVLGRWSEKGYGLEPAYCWKPGELRHRRGRYTLPRPMVKARKFGMSAKIIIQSGGLGSIKQGKSSEQTSRGFGWEITDRCGCTALKSYWHC